ncbi:hypothetical protein CSKR_106776 [Clonorchis sinensis]|uniref:Uncharacterized protein n=1 Tax=Clonorchis sinensis TaxID=79923 RepID=A0A3R7CZS2_CLOSI|nr:hypothetical protein CSKR_106776 [Clonorchis sinensis]
MSVFLEVNHLLCETRHNALSDESCSCAVLNRLLLSWFKNSVVIICRVQHISDPKDYSRGNANALPFLRNKSPHVKLPSLEDQEAEFVRPLTIGQPGLRDPVSREHPQYSSMDR